MTLTISGAPDKINYDEEFDISVDLSDAPQTTTYYLQAAITASANPAYFGYTQKNDGTWHKYSESFDNFLEITTNTEGSWSGKLRAKPDADDKDFKGNGEYIVKIGRFTLSGKSHYWSDNNLNVTISAPATPAPTPKPTSTPKATSTSKPTATTKPTPTSKSSSTTIKSTSTPISSGQILTLAAATTENSEDNVDYEASASGTVSGVSIIKTSNTPLPKVSTSSSNQKAAGILMTLAGLATLGVAISTFLVKKKKGV